MQLAAVVKLWSATLDPRTALAATNLAAKVAHEDWPDAKPKQQAMWLARAKAPVGHEVELVRMFDFVKLKAADVLARLEAMTDWAPHPIVTRWLVNVFETQTRAPMLDGMKCFRRIFNLLATHIDLDGAARFRGWIGTQAARIRASEFGAKFFDDGMQRVLDRAADRLAKARALTARELASLEAAGLLAPIAQPAAEPSLDALFAEVYATPWDDGPRLVLADVLQAKGDPRGEFIALDLLAQPTAEQRKRRNALVKAHGKSWFPQALHRVVNRSATYERGFLARGELVGKHTPIELSTFREVDVDRAVTIDLDITHPCFKGITAWRGLDVDALPGLGPLPRVTCLGVRAYDVSAKTLALALQPETWSSLTELTIEWIAQRWTNADQPRWFDELAVLIGPRLPRVELLRIGTIATYRRDGAAMKLVEVTLSKELINELTWDFRTDARDRAHERWFAWLEANGVPIPTA